MNEKLPTQPYKGSRDFYPQDMRIRNLIFNAWKKVCKRYGYEEYDGPFIESFDIYAAKSGQEIVNEQLYSFIDRGERKVAIRPEMTPSLARMVAGKYFELPQPIRWFSIPNLWRYERPQKGRLREHYQLNVDCFGIPGVEAEFELISIIVDILKEFGTTEEMFEVRINNRRLTDAAFRKLGFNEVQKQSITKAIDKMNKISKEDFEDLLEKEVDLTREEISKLQNFLSSPTEIIEEIMDENTDPEGKVGAKEIKDLLSLAEKQGISSFVKFDPTIMRGFDYYTGTVFELYDLNPDNNRSMCGGGRYDNLVGMFIDQTLSGVGFGMGDVTFKSFLESWNLMPEVRNETDYFITTWPDETGKSLQITNEIARSLRSEGKNVSVWPETNTKVEKQLKYADKMGFRYAVIVGEEELKDKKITIKDMIKKEQKTLDMREFLNKLI